ncbi:MAG: beta-ketoacyl-[acyl-carrier-protein] synthase family protein [Abitibacteriaceae bacterium]|nr:beta-ketoacyl-[acyl-carrier-protein] synthase family protein [Abditibacteriaceae bacterium]
MERIVITGMGCVCPLGNDVPSFWAALIAGQSGIRPLTKLDTSGLRNATGGEVQNFDWSDYGEEGDCDEASQFAFAAAHEAIADAHLSDVALAQAGMVFSTNFGGAASWETVCDMIPDTGEVDAELFRQFTLEDAANYTAGRLHINGPRVTLTNACSSGGNAIGLACDWLRVGRCDIALAGGHDGLGLSSLAGLSILRTISPELCRPFDKNRNGTIFGEGAAMLVLETWSSAERRNAKVYAEVVGWAVNNNAYHLTAPDKDGAGLRAVMSAALRDANISPTEIDYINAHGTGTPYNDLAETQAIKAVLGEHAKQVPVSSIKAATSHTMGAAGGLEAIATVQALIEQKLPPTLNYETPDPECDLDYVPNQARPVTLRVALSNSSGIGGNNASLILRVV